MGRSNSFGEAFKMKLVISGGGHGEDTKEQVELFASLLDKSKPLIYVPIAIDKNKHPYNSCLDFIKSEFQNTDINNIEMWLFDELEKSKNHDPKAYSGIYIGGGNTPYLLNKLKQTEFWDFLKKSINADIPIMGGSAGAIIFAKSIIPAIYYDMNWIELKDLSGMNSIDDWEITCHYTDEEENKTKQVIKENNFDKLVALTDKNGLYVTDENIVLVGQESAWIFDRDGNKKELNVGEKLA